MPCPNAFPSGIFNTLLIRFASKEYNAPHNSTIYCIIHNLCNKKSPAILWETCALLPAIDYHCKCWLGVQVIHCAVCWVGCYTMWRGKGILGDWRLSDYLRYEIWFVYFFRLSDIALFVKMHRYCTNHIGQSVFCIFVNISPSLSISKKNVPCS